MKKIIYIPTMIVLCAAAANAQEHIRRFDNFDTTNGVKIVYQQASVKTVETIANARKPTKHYLPSPPHGEQYNNTANFIPVQAHLIKSAKQQTMRVSDGYAEQDRRRSAISAKPLTAVNGHLNGLSTGDLYVDSYIVESSRRYGIDPLLIYSQMAQESSFKRLAKSNKGASGLMQLMPATARRLGVTNIYDPKQNIEGGVKYMRILLDLFDQDLNLALAGYNAGEGAVIKYGYQIPPYNETRDYVRRISSRYRTITAPTTARFVNKSGSAVTQTVSSGLK